MINTTTLKTYYRDNTVTIFDSKYKSIPKVYSGKAGDYTVHTIRTSAFFTKNEDLVDIKPFVKSNTIIEYDQDFKSVLYEILSEMEKLTSLTIEDLLNNNHVYEVEGISYTYDDKLLKHLVNLFSEDKELFINFCGSNTHNQILIIHNRDFSEIGMLSPRTV